MPGANPQSQRVGQFQNGDIITVASRAGSPPLAVFEPAPFTPSPTGGQPPPPPCVEDCLLKDEQVRTPRGTNRLTHPACVAPLPPCPPHIPATAAIPKKAFVTLCVQGKTGGPFRTAWAGTCHAEELMSSQCQTDATPPCPRIPLTEYHGPHLYTCSSAVPLFSQCHRDVHDVHSTCGRSSAGFGPDNRLNEEWFGLYNATYEDDDKDFFITLVPRPAVTTLQVFRAGGVG